MSQLKTSNVCDSSFHCSTKSINEYFLSVTLVSLSSPCSLTLCSTGSFQTPLTKASSLHAHSFVCAQDQYIFVHQCLLQWLSRGTGGSPAWWECRNKLPPSTNTHHIEFAARGSVLLVTETCDDIIIRCPLFLPAAHRFREPVQILTTTLRISLMAPGGSGQGGGDATVAGRNLHQSRHRAQYSRF